MPELGSLAAHGALLTALIAEGYALLLQPQERLCTGEAGAQRFRLLLPNLPSKTRQDSRLQLPRANPRAIVRLARWPTAHRHLHPTHDAPRI